jgi:hypothetical protein
LGVGKANYDNFFFFVGVGSSWHANIMRVKFKSGVVAKSDPAPPPIKHKQCEANLLTLINSSSSIKATQQRPYKT